MGGIVKTDFCYQVGLLTQSRLKHTLSEKMESGEVQVPNYIPIHRKRGVGWRGIFATGNYGLGQAYD